jgi:hypothetical protein
MKIKSLLLVTLVCSVLVCLTSITKSQAPTATAPASASRFSASISFHFQTNQVIPKGIEVDDVAKALSAFYAAHDKSDFTLDEVGNIEIFASAPSAKGSKAFLKDIAKITVTFSPAERRQSDQ